MLSLFQLLAGLIVITAAFAWINHRFVHLPANIGVLVMGLGASLLLIGVGLLFPDAHIYGPLAASLQQIDFYDVLMHGILAFLLFAGAIQVDLGRLRNRALGVAVLATVGVVVSTAIVAIGTWWMARLFGFELSFGWALVFGALIAPTDPVAVLSTLKTVDVPQNLRTDMSGETLFNDGVAIVLFAIAVDAVSGSGDTGLVRISELLLWEAAGGGLFGLTTGYIGYRALRSIDDFAIEVMISLALVMGTYAAADAMHMSGPLAVVVAGVLIGNRGAAHAMSETTKRYLFGFWTLTDEILNSVLFLLIGLEVLVLAFESSQWLMGLAAVPLALIGRFAAVGGAATLLGRWVPFAKGTIPVLTWGGVRGGISVALALSLPGGSHRPIILAATYSVVIFSVVVQGLTLGYVIRKTALPDNGK